MRNLAEYILAAKRVSALFYGDRTQLAQLQKVMKNFRFARFGVVPSLTDKTSRRSNILILNKIFSPLENLIEIISETTGCSMECAETAFFSAALCAPVVTIPENLEHFFPIATMKFRGDASTPLSKKIFTPAVEIAERIFVPAVEIATDFAEGKLTRGEAINRRRNLALEAFRNSLWTLGDGTTGEVLALAVDPLLGADWTPAQIADVVPTLFGMSIVIAV
ncbi:hypothetical protein J7K99_01970 [bacterium]|nr:hypothetical protein [bacterium]